MAARPPAQLTVDQEALVALRRALDREADGKKLRRELGVNLRKAVAPAVVDAKAAVRALPSVTSGDPPLREAVASKISAQARQSGRTPGVSIRQSGKGMPRGFRLAGRRLNQSRGWRHPVFGSETWVPQSGRQWFEPAILRRKGEYRDAVVAAMNDMAERIATGARRR
jgi:hypothetical protein